MCKIAEFSIDCDEIAWESFILPGVDCKERVKLIKSSTTTESAPVFFLVYLVSRKDASLEVPCGPGAVTAHEQHHHVCGRI